MKLYLGLASLALTVLYLPLVLIGLIILCFKVKRWKNRAWAIPLYLAIAYLIPLGDVTWHSWKMAQVCPQAGLHVYRRVKVDGFMDQLSNGNDLQKEGYLFAEYFPDRVSGLVTRWERTATGTRKLDKVPPISEWEFVSDISRPDRDLGVNKGHDFIRNRVTGEIIAETLWFTAWRGWLDRWIGSIIENSAGGCDGGANILRAYLSEILIPSQEARQ